MVESPSGRGILTRLVIHKKKLMALSLTACVLWAVFYPQRFIGLWLTPDQQGQILFDTGYYELAARRFNNPLWKAMAFYGAEEFKPSATLFSQYRDENGLLARANALAHAREYIPAVAVYKQLLKAYPDNSAAKTNIAIIQALIDANQMLSESQQAEAGELAQDEKGPASSDGDEREIFDTQLKKQLTAEQLLQDPALTEMWMRQVQKDPSQFLSIKFFMQLEQQEKQTSNNLESPP